MELPGQRRFTRRFLSEFHTKGHLHSPAPPPSSLLGPKPPPAPAQPSLQSTPGSLAEQAALMEQQFDGFARKSTEELFIQSFVESSTKVSSLASLPPDAVAENLGSFSQVTELEKFTRGDSEELFSSWVSAGTTLNQVCNPILLGSPVCGEGGSASVSGLVNDHFRSCHGLG